MKYNNWCYIKFEEDSTSISFNSPTFDPAILYVLYHGFIIIINAPLFLNKMSLLKKLGIVAAATFFSLPSIAAAPAPKTTSPYTVKSEEYGYTMFMSFKKEDKSYAVFRFDAKNEVTKSKRCVLSYSLADDDDLMVIDHYCDGIADVVGRYDLSDAVLGGKGRVKEVADKANDFLRKFYAKHDIGKRIDEYLSTGKYSESYKGIVAIVHSTIDKGLVEAAKKDSKAEVFYHSPGFFIKTKTLIFNYSFISDVPICYLSSNLDDYPHDYKTIRDFDIWDSKCDGSVDVTSISSFSLMWGDIHILPKDKSAFDGRMQKVLDTFYETYDIKGMIRSEKERLDESLLKESEIVLDKVLLTI